jgi:hypothetical protein
MGECPDLQKCGFMRKYEKIMELSVQGFIRLYCKGNMQAECKRKEYKNKNGQPPSDDMMPSGQMTER